MAYILRLVSGPASFPRPEVRPGLPPAHQTQLATGEFGGVLLQGTIWDEAAMRGPDGATVLYKDWPEPQFGYGDLLYRTTSGAATGPEATAAEVAFIIDKLLRGRAGKVADVACGAGRIAFALAALGVEVVGFEPIEEPLAAARAAAGQHIYRVPPVFELMRPETLASAKHLRQYLASLCIFNCMGYKLEPEADEAHMGQMFGLVAPGGTLSFDTRSYEYQKDHYGKEPVTVIDSMTDPVGNVLLIETTKYCPADKLAAEEKVTLNGKLLQWMTYGWNMHPTKKVEEMLLAMGGVNARHIDDRYSSQGEEGERTRFLVDRPV